eukprot:5857827-Pyramimonas_sp.AAC.2
MSKTLKEGKPFLVTKTPTRMFRKSRCMCIFIPQCVFLLLTPVNPLVPGLQSCPGIIPLAIQEVFGIIQNTPSRDYLLRVSYIEVRSTSDRPLAGVTCHISRMQRYYYQGMGTKLPENRP